mmetsp:Transcript_21243/g.56772  ORF Transcript_21243/g.56772 Transcript_21243/m.56772 type:complete len:209 (+) Transcript_21243:1166-1792(+)
MLAAIPTSQIPVRRNADSPCTGCSATSFAEFAVSHRTLASFADYRGGWPQFSSNESHTTPTSKPRRRSRLSLCTSYCVQCGPRDWRRSLARLPPARAAQDPSDPRRHLCKNPLLAGVFPVQLSPRRAICPWCRETLSAPHQVEICSVLQRLPPPAPPPSRRQDHAPQGSPGARPCLHKQSLTTSATVSLPIVCLALHTDPYRQTTWHP